MLRLVGVALTSFSAGSAQFDLLDPERREKLRTPGAGDRPAARPLRIFQSAIWRLASRSR